MSAVNPQLRPLELKELSQESSVVPLHSQAQYPTTLALSDIQLPSSQPRRYFDPIALHSLAQSIAQYGILEPLLVRPIDERRYELVAGERRYRAAQKVGLSQVPVIIRALSDREALRIALLENLQREDLNPIEETESILKLLSLELQQPAESIVLLLHRLRNQAKGKKTHNVMGNAERETIRTIFQSIGTMTWESFVSNRLPLLKLPEAILNALRQGQLSYTKALAISRVRQPNQQNHLLQEAISRDLSLSEIRKQVASLNSPETTSNLPSSLRDRWSYTYRRLQQSGVLNDPLKRQRVESLMAELITIAELDESQEID